MTNSVRPPIPVRLAHRPTVGGLVQPWVNVQLADGGVDFRRANGTHWRRAWTEGRCQICSERLGRLFVMIGGPDQLAEGGVFDEAPMHPECAAYVTLACPMVAGRMTHFRPGPSLTEGARGQDCGVPGCDCGGYTDTEQVLHADGAVTIRRTDSTTSSAGKAAHPWYAVYARAYHLAVTPEEHLLGGIPSGIIRTRQISSPTPGES
ncbi:hypothetical protein [Nonomuraea endophytica]|uniref:hypothetical protein n=1 Tax=Nonomuraea endophytica TaxID=714136 RepID=UPI0037C7CBAF